LEAISAGSPSEVVAEHREHVGQAQGWERVHDVRGGVAAAVALDHTLERDARIYCPISAVFIQLKGNAEWFGG
jgi:hypothetical protein